MPKNFIFLFFFTIFILNENVLVSKAAEGQVVAECLIYSDQYRQYIYRSWTGFLATWYPNRGFFAISSPYNSPMEYSEKDPKGLWYFEPVDGSVSTFFIRNKKKNEYLHTSRVNFGFLAYGDTSRLVVTNKKIKREYYETYMWKLERISDDRFTIKNIKYDEALTARQDRDEDGRPSASIHIYTSSVPQEQIWTLRCKDKKLPFIA